MIGIDTSTTQGSVIAREIVWAFRRLRHRARRTVLVVAVLGLALATNAVMLGVLDQLFFAAPALVRNPENVVRVMKSTAGRGEGHALTSRFSYPELQAMRARIGDAATVAGAYTTTVSVGEGEQSIRTLATFATSEYGRMTGVSPFVGRWFTDAEDIAPEGSPVVLLGHAFWQRWFAGDASAIGRSLRIGEMTFTVIGILPAGFRGTDQQVVDLWMPLSIAGTRFQGTTWDFDANRYWIEIVARTAPGRTPATIEAMLRRGTAARGAELFAAPLNRTRAPGSTLEARVSLWLEGVAAIVLLIACANVGTLHLVHGIERQPELAVRLALGGTGAHIVASIVSEAALTSVGAGCFATLVSPLTARWLVAHFLGDVVDVAAVLSARTALLSLGLVVVVTLATAILPLMHLRADQLHSLIRSAGPTSGRLAHRWRSALVGIQVALTTILLCGAGLFLKSFHAVSTIDSGFDPDRIVVIDLDRQAGAPTALLEQDLRQVAHAIERDPIAEGSAIGVSAPFLSGVAVRLEIPGRDTLPTETGGAIYVNAVTPSFFGVMGLRLTAGRLLAAGGSNPLDAVVTQHFADIIWPGENAIGKCFHIYSREAPCRTVIGIIANPERDKLGEEPVAQFFVPLASAPSLSSTRLLFVRVRGTPDDAARHLATVARRVLPHAPHPRIQPLATMISRQQRPWAVGALLFAVFSALALFIAAIGLYNVIYHDVRARQRELAIRITLGATPSHVVDSVAASTGVAIVGGVIGGLVVATWAGTRIEPILFRTSGVDPVVDILIAATLFGVAIAAALGPLRAAVNTEPAETLRTQ